MYNIEKYDWETREDAETLKRYQAIKSDPNRLSKARDCIKDSLRIDKAVIKDTPIYPNRRSNKATVGSLKFKY